MARGVNKVILVGNLGADPETRSMPSGMTVTNIRIATSESWKDKASGAQQERTEWHSIALFGRLGEIAAEYLRKGSQVFVEGKLRTRKWQDKQGNDRLYHRNHRRQHADARRPRRRRGWGRHDSGTRRHERPAPGRLRSVAGSGGRQRGFRRRHSVLGAGERQRVHSCADRRSGLGGALWRDHADGGDAEAIRVPKLLILLVYCSHIQVRLLPI